ncbi:putative tetratricopeptide-like helical domain superfamily [Helianthus debilis subsp. tardiflorus]
MLHTRPLPSVVKFTQLLTAVSKMKHFSSCLHLFKQMCAVGVPVDKYSISIAIRCCCQMSRTNDGFALLASCFRRAVVPNVFVFSTLLDGLVLEDRILEAEILFKKLIKQKLCEPDVVMYSTMIKGLCKFGNNDIAIGLLRLMDERGCKPNTVVYNTIIDSLCKDKLIDDAYKLFKEMVSHKGILPNVITYTSLIHGLCNLCRWDEVSKLLKEMEDLRISPNFQTFSILVLEEPYPTSKE